MKILANKDNNIVLCFAKTAEVSQTGIMVDRGLGTQCNYCDVANINVFDAEVTIPGDFMQGKYLYTIDGGLAINSNYTPYVSPEQRIAELEAQNAQMLLALVNGGLM